MTVETTLSRAQYGTNGTTGPWTVPFYFLADADLRVIYTDASGNETVLVLTTNYTVTGAGVDAGGTVTTVTAYASGGYITVLRNVEALQETDYADGDSFPAETHERALDKLTMLIQQALEVVGRALVFSPSDPAGSTLPAASARANKLLGFNGAGVLTLTVPTDGTAASLAINLADTASASNGDALIGVKQVLAGAVARTQHAKNAEFVSPEDFGADPTGVVDSTAAINAAVTASARVVGTGHYLNSGVVTLRAGGTLVLDRVTSSAAFKSPTGNDTSLYIREWGVSNAFPAGGNMLELGVAGDTVRYDSFKLGVGLANGKSPDAVTRANVIRNYNRTFSDFEMIRVRDVRNVYTCDGPAVALGDNRIHGALIENAYYGLYLHGTAGGVNHVEHHELDYNFVAGCVYGAVYARGRAHYQVMMGAYDFNGQGLVKLGFGSAPTPVVGDAIVGSVTGATGTVTAVTGNELIAIRTAGTFTTADSVGGTAVTSVVIYGVGGVYLDFISQTQSGFARHTLDCAYLTNLFGNNQEDWVIFSATNSSNRRAQLAGQGFYASSTEQYTQLSLPAYSVRYSAVNVLNFTATIAELRNANGAAVVAANTGAWKCADGSGIDLMVWTTAAGAVNFQKPIGMVAIAAASAPNNSFFLDVADSLPKWKDGGGVLRLLY